MANPESISVYNICDFMPNFSPWEYDRWELEFACGGGAFTVIEAQNLLHYLDLACVSDQDQDFVHFENFAKKNPNALITIG